MKRIVFTLVCLAVLFATVTEASADCRVVSLMYHNVTRSSERWDDWCISPDTLEEDINYFRDRGFITLTATELAEEKYETLDGKDILLLTFDDGYIGWYDEVFPVLKKLQAKATMFVVGGFINRYGYMGENQIWEISQSGLVEIGNHTDHIHQMPLDTLKGLYAEGRTDDIVTDIKNNGKKLEKITGKPVTSISWPYGYTTKNFDNAVKKNLGYKISFSTAYGVNRFGGDLSVLFNRINRPAGISSEQLYSNAVKLFDSIQRH